MIRADLHVHSKASKRPSEWFLQKVGAKESYTGIDTLYSTAKAAGMDFVTITDHNTIEGALELVEKYPDVADHIAEWIMAKDFSSTARLVKEIWDEAA